MFLTVLVGLTALLVAGTAAYFSVLGIATLFSGSYYQVMIMAGALELGKLVATSFLHRFWKKTNFLLKTYLILAVLVLMGITSMGVFGYLSAAYQANSSTYAHIASQVALIEEQKQSIDKEIEQNNSRINTLNESRASQEKRLPNLSRTSAAPIYKDIERSGEEIKALNERIVTLQQTKLDKDNQIVELKQETAKANDIGTFKFIAEAVNLPIDVVVTIFICVLIFVFDPLAVSLVLAFNAMTEKKSEEPIYNINSSGFSTSDENMSYVSAEDDFAPNWTDQIAKEDSEKQKTEVSAEEQKAIDKKRHKFYWHNPSLKE
jgi:uncharacterized coiled-coil protein SlyX